LAVLSDLPAERSRHSVSLLHIFVIHYVSYMSCFFPTCVGLLVGRVLSSIRQRMKRTYPNLLKLSTTRASVVDPD
jgi:hypothetical protein